MTNGAPLRFTFYCQIFTSTCHQQLIGSHLWLWILFTTLPTSPLPRGIRARPLASIIFSYNSVGDVLAYSTTRSATCAKVSANCIIKALRKKKIVLTLNRELIKNTTVITTTHNSRGPCIRAASSPTKFFFLHFCREADRVSCYCLACALCLDCVKCEQKRTLTIATTAAYTEKMCTSQTSKSVLVSVCVRAVNPFAFAEMCSLSGTRQSSTAIPTSESSLYTPANENNYKQAAMTTHKAKEPRSSSEREWQEDKTKTLRW